MNDATLKKLSIKPGNLEPDFKPNIKSYYVILPSDVKYVVIDPRPNDKEATWTVVGHGNKRQLQVWPGTKQNLIIEVTAENGTTKRYTVVINCLSSSDVSLLDLSMSSWQLDPPFSNDIYKYVVRVPWYISQVEANAVPTDPNMSITINNSVNKSVPLNFSETDTEIEVVSCDKKVKKTINIAVLKDKLNYWIAPKKFEFQASTRKFECVACLNMPRFPRVVKREQPWYVFCKGCMEAITRRYPYHPILHTPLFENFMAPLESGETEAANLKVVCPFAHYGCQADPIMSSIGEHIYSCGRRPLYQLDDKNGEEILKADLNTCHLCSRKTFAAEREFHSKYNCLAKHTSTKFTHTVEVRPWERNLQQEYQGVGLEPLSEGCAPDPTQRCPIAAIKNLTVVARKYATALTMDSDDAKLHFKLGQTLEEIHIAKDIYGVTSDMMDDEADLTEDDDGMAAVELGADEANEEEVRAICKARNLPASATPEQVLKALDEEYRSLLDQSLSSKADYVQTLYTWKSKKLNEAGRNEQFVQGNLSLLDKAVLKYLDAATVDPNKHAFHLHAGRLLIGQENYDDAVLRLNMAVTLKPTSIQARFYLAIALALTNNEVRGEECLRFLREGIDYFILKLHALEESSLKEASSFLSCNFVGANNVLALEGMIHYANLLRNPEIFNPEDMDVTRFKIRQALHVACITGMLFLGRLYHDGETKRRVKMTILEAQYQLGIFNMAEDNTDPSNEVKIANYWSRLASLLKAFCLPREKDVLELEEKICEEAVFAQPCSSQALSRLADSRVAMFDYDVKKPKHLLQEADILYRLSISLEEKSSLGQAPESTIFGAPWYADRLREKNEENASKRSEAESKTKTPAAAASGTDKTGAAAKATKDVKTTVPKQQVTKASTVGKKPDNKKMSFDSKKPTNNNITITISGPGDGSETAAGHSGQADEVKNGMETTNEDASLHVNVPSYLTRLGLARVLTRYEDKKYETEIHALYREVISMAPYIHDAYIELGEILADIEGIKAVDLYASYPFSSNISMDDAYLHGEIVRLMMKGGYFLDPRLATSMVMYGKALGVSVLESYVKRLEATGHYIILRKIYAAINNRPVDDPEMQNFFIMKGW